MTTPQRLAAFLLPIAPIALGGCFATQQDIRVLQGDIATVRAERLAADSAERLQLDRVIAQLAAANDSLGTMSTRLTQFRSDASTSLSSMQQQLLQVQELTGQSQRRLQEVRTSLEERQQAAAAAAPAPGATGGAPTADVTPGPNQLYQIARQQMLQGSNSAARTAFEDLLRKYPKSDLAPEAQFYVAETYAAEGNTSAADSVYARVAAKYRGSPRAATAIYKRAILAQSAGKTKQARALFTEVIRKYPRSDEAALSHDRLRVLK